MGTRVEWTEDDESAAERKWTPGTVVDTRWRDGEIYWPYEVRMDATPEEGTFNVGCPDADDIRGLVGESPPPQPNRVDATNDKKCGNCGMATETLRLCKGCLEVYFCNAECQKEAWRRHKVACKAAMQRLRAGRRRDGRDVALSS